MINMKIQVQTPKGNELSIKEALAMYLEQFGAVSVPDVAEDKDGIILTVHIQARTGRVRRIQKTMLPYLKWFSDTTILSIREELC